MIKMYLKTEFPLIFYHFQGPTRLSILSPPHVIFLLFFLFVICKQTFIVQQTALQYAKAGGSQCQNVRLWFMIVQNHYSNVIMSVMASQITSRTIIYSNVYSGTDQRNHQNSASMAFWGGGGEFTSDRRILRTKASNAENDVMTSSCPMPFLTAKNYIETEMSSFWWNFHHWLHWKLSFWQLPVQPVNISSKWQHFCFSGHKW